MPNIESKIRILIEKGGKYVQFPAVKRPIIQRGQIKQKIVILNLGDTKLFRINQYLNLNSFS